MCISWLSPCPLHTLFLYQNFLILLARFCTLNIKLVNVLPQMASVSNLFMIFDFGEYKQYISLLYLHLLFQLYVFIFILTTQRHMQEHLHLASIISCHFPFWKEPPTTFIIHWQRNNPSKSCPTRNWICLIYRSNIENPKHRTTCHQVCPRGKHVDSIPWPRRE